MKLFVTTITFALALAFAGAAHAGAVKSKAECEAAGGKWDEANKICSGN